MAIYGAVGQAFAVEGREAVTDAIYQALSQFESQSVSLAIIFASHEYNFQDILSGFLSQMGEVPVIGVSTSGEMTKDGSHRRSVVVAFLGGDDIKARAEFVGNFSEDSAGATEQLFNHLGFPEIKSGNLIVVSDGMSGEVEALIQGLPQGEFVYAGCSAGGDIRLGRTYQIGGDKMGSSGLAAAWVDAPGLKMGVGVSHGWKPVGVQFQVTDTRGPWLRTLDESPAVDRYAEMFGKPAREWAFPPLSTLVRLYPLGFERSGQDLQIRTPIRVEADGSLRMQSQVEDGSMGQLMVGSIDHCREAARNAAQYALNQLGKAKPILALVYADMAWEMLLKSHPGVEVKAVSEVLGDAIPIAGGYILGQIARLPNAPSPEFLNQHIEVVIFGVEE